MTEADKHRIEIAHMQVVIDLLVVTLKAVHHAVPKESKFREPIDDAFYKLKLLGINALSGECTWTQ